MLPTFDFFKLPLSSSSQKQLAGIYRASRGTQLLKWILEHVHDPEKGTFLPVSTAAFGKDVSEARHLRYAITSPFRPFPCRYFSNTLIISDAFTGKPPGPKGCATNIGLVVATVELDSNDRGVFEETLAWTRGTDVDFSSSPFALLDGRLLKYCDYRGYSVVFSGNKSLHFHFVFSTKHLGNAPCEIGPVERVASASEHSAVLHAAHEMIWDRVSDVFTETLNPPVPPDRTLRSLTQWRRAPWAIRMLDTASVVLGLPVGAAVPQIVIHENIRTRAAVGSSEVLVPGNLSSASPHHSRRSSSGSFRSAGVPNATIILEKMKELCVDEWGGKYPEPISVKSKTTSMSSTSRTTKETNDRQAMSGVSSGNSNY
jgi:hypothetical protein